MADRILAPIGTFTPWARAVANSIVDVENPQTVEVVLLHAELDEPDSASISTKSLDERVQGRSSVSRATERLEDSGFDVTVRGRAANELSEVILEEVETWPADRLYMHARRRSPTGKVVYGSTIQRVLANAPVPVVVVPSAAVGSLTETNRHE